MFNIKKKKLRLKVFCCPQWLKVSILPHQIVFSKEELIIKLSLLPVCPATDYSPTMSQFKYQFLFGTVILDYFVYFH